MLKKIFSKIVSFLPQIVALFFISVFAVFAWTGPGGPPPDNNADAPINVGSAPQLKSGALGIGGLLWGYSDAIFNGKVGIGTISPGQLLHLKSSAGDAAIRLQANISSTNQTATFNYTGSSQTWTVPAWVTSVSIEMHGGHGSNGFSGLAGGGAGGYGAKVIANVSVTPGDVLSIYVGGAGSPNPFPGGGAGGSGGTSNNNFGGSGGNGGGSSYIMRSGLYVALAAGGGGGGGGSAGCTMCSGGTAGSASSLNGENGQGGGTTSYYLCPNQGGYGGTQSAGGAGGGPVSGCIYSSGQTGLSGFAGRGGDGAPGGTYFGGGGGGGGGGGYWGGGGGGGGGPAYGWPAGGGGGGAGSSLIPVGGSVTQSPNLGNGQVIITYSSNADTNWIIGAGPATNGKFKISNSSVFGTTDALILDDQGIILKAFNGSNCYRIRTDNSGTISTISVACP